MKEARLIGKGSFTKAYLSKNNKILLKSNCKIKEIMAIGKFPESKLFPKVKYYDKEYSAFKYEMDYYPDMKDRKVLPKLNDYYKKMYRELQFLQFNYYNNNFKKKNYGSRVEGEHRDGFFYLVDKMSIKTYHKEAIKCAYEGCMNIISDYSIGFEISPRNVATRKGKLILMDCFYEIRF